MSHINALARVFKLWAKIPTMFVGRPCEATKNAADTRGTFAGQPTNSWYEKDGIVYFRITFDGTKGVDWMPRLEKKGFRLGDLAKQMLRSLDFKPTQQGTTVDVAVLRSGLFADSDRDTETICAYAEACTMPDQRELIRSNSDLACLIREQFTDEDLKAMGLQFILVMHKSVNGKSLFCVDRDDTGRRLYAYYDRPFIRWGRDGGFAFILSSSEFIRGSSLSFLQF